MGRKFWHIYIRNVHYFKCCVSTDFSTFLSRKIQKIMYSKFYLNGYTCIGNIMVLVENGE